MMRLRALLPIMLLAVLAHPAACFAAQTAAEAQAVRFAEHDSTAYTLPPEKLQKAIALNRTRMVLEITGTLWTLAQLGLLLALGAAARMRDVAVGLSKKDVYKRQGVACISLAHHRSLAIDQVPIHRERSQVGARCV